MEFNKTEFENTDGAYKFLIALAIARFKTKKELAKMIGTSSQGITNALSRGNVKLSSLKEMANVLNVEVKISLTDKNHKNEPNKITIKSKKND
jgi:DNA-binding phage protein